MHRSHSRLSAELNAAPVARPNEAWDALIHFLQDAYHLKDWLKNDPTVSVTNALIEDAINQSVPLKLCADLANGSKHLRLLRNTRTGDQGTAVVTHTLVAEVGDWKQVTAIGTPGTVIPPGATSSLVATTVTGITGMEIRQAFEVESNGQRTDAEQLAVQVTQAWDGWLKKNGLL